MTKKFSETDIKMLEFLIDNLFVIWWMCVSTDSQYNYRYHLLTKKKLAMSFKFTFKSKDDVPQIFFLKFIYFDSDMYISINTVVYFEGKDGIYSCGQCHTQFMLPYVSRRQLINMCFYDGKVSFIDGASVTIIELNEICKENSLTDVTLNVLIN